MDQYIERIVEKTQTVKKFQFTGTRGVYEIKNMETCTDPEGFLRQLFKHIMDKTIEEGNVSGIEPDHIGVIISSVNLANNILVSYYIYI
jgi:hypothetical protein